MASFKAFCNVTTLHGFKDFYDSKHIFKIFWLSLIIASLVMTCFQVIQVSRGYLENPTATKLEIKTLRLYKFPDLGVCPSRWANETKVNQLNLSADALIFASSILYNVSQRWNKEKVKAVSKEFFDFLLENNYTLEEFYVSLMIDYQNLFDISMIVHINRGISPTYRKQYSASGKFCFVVSFPDIKEVVLLYEPFAFRLVYDQNQLHETSIDSTFTDSDNYADTVSPIYPNLLISGDRRIRYSLENLEMKPNFAYVVSIRLWNAVRLTTPTYRCYTSEEVENDIMYSRKYCQTECLEKNLIERNCTQCYTFGWSPTVDNSKPNTFPMCSWLDGAAGIAMSNKCLSLVGREGFATTCICPPTCEQMRYEVSIMAESEWLKNKTIVKVIFNPADGIIYFEEVSTYSWEIFVSNIGGQLGLWMGGSIVSLIQVVYHILLWFIEKKLTRSFNLSMSFGKVNPITKANA